MKRPVASVGLGMFVPSDPQDLSKYTVLKSFVGIAVTTRVVGMLAVLAIPSKAMGMQAVQKLLNESLCSTFKHSKRHFKYPKLKDR